MISELILTNLGLSPNEAKIYLATLELGISAAQTIAKKARLKRTTSYSILEAMVVKGLILKTNIEGHHKYLSENPKVLAERFKAHQKSFENVLPELEAIHNKRDTKPKVLFFEDEDGIKKIYDDTLREKPKKILEFNTSEMQKLFPDFPEKYLQQRRGKNIEAVRIAPDDIFWKSHQKNDTEELSETKLIKNFNIPVEINVYNNKVAFMSYSEKIGLIIESEGIAESMRKIYELIWDRI
jgi:sugar-specific transcriptional regulator TrmB